MKAAVAAGNGLIAGGVSRATGSSAKDSLYAGVTTTAATFFGFYVADFAGSSLAVGAYNFAAGSYIGGTVEGTASVIRGVATMASNGRRTAQTARRASTMGRRLASGPVATVV